MSGLRAILQPKARPVESGLGVFGATLRLEALGPEPQVAPGTHPATLRFVAGYLDTGRPTATPDFVQFATLNVELVVDEAGQPSMTVEPEADYLYDNPEPASPLLPRICELSFDADSFAGSIEDGSPLTRLRLPRDPEGMRYVEVGVEVELDGDVVAPHTSHDRLDIPLRNYVDILLLDGEDLPMSGVRYTVELGNREIVSGVLDDDGAARLVELPSNRCRITFPELVPQTDLRALSVEEVPEELR